jgi:hypothetical protein
MRTATDASARAGPDMRGNYRQTLSRGTAFTPRDSGFYLAAFRRRDD